MESPTRLAGGRYYVLKKLSDNVVSVVYKAKDTVLNRVVAVKVIKKASPSETTPLLLHEAQTAVKLRHPNIVSIQDVGTVRVRVKELGVKGWIKGESKKLENPFFVLDFVDGMTLQTLMDTRPDRRCEMQTVLRTSIDVCKALQCAHSQDILHLGIRPESILITKENVAKLADFGLAVALGEPRTSEKGRTGDLLAYAAPEVAMSKNADPRSDLYSLGAVLYEMVTGKPPFPGKSPAEIVSSHISDYPASPSKLNPEVPVALDNCIMKLLEKEPGERYQTAVELLKALREITDGFITEAFVSPGKLSVVVPSPRPMDLREIQLIDRVEEMSLLRETIDRTAQGRGGVVFLNGEAGIGKTRLAQELGAYARLRGMQVLTGRCPALFRVDGVPPYVLWKEVVRDYLEGRPVEQLHRIIGHHPDEVAKLVPELKQKLGEFPQSLPISPEHERDRLFEAVSQFVTNISRETPLLVILDDLQWTDQSSLLLMHYLARGAYKEPLLLLGAYRDTYIDQQHPLSPILAELNRERLLQSVPLKRLSFDDTAKMIERTLEQEDVSKALCELVYEKTRGNPFFVEEVIKSLKEEEVIYQEGDKWKTKEVSRIEFPKTVKDVIMKRVSRLDDECQRVLTLASFLGRDCAFEALSGATDLEEGDLLEIVDKMHKSGLMTETVVHGEEVCSFADIIVRDVVHEEVSPLRHKRLHQAVGSVLEKVYAEKIDEHSGELALHFLESGDKEKALYYFVNAGEKAAHIYANDEAIHYFQSALRLLEEKEGEFLRRAHILEKLGDIKKLVGEFDASVEHFKGALMFRKRLNERDDISRLHRKIADILFSKMANWEEAEKHHNEALKNLETEQESLELVRLHISTAHMHWQIGETTKALLLARKALDLAKKRNDSETITKSYAALGTISSLSGDTTKGAKYLERALKMALDNGFIETALNCYVNLGSLLPAEENERRLEYSKKGAELAKKVGDITYQSWFCINLGEMYLGMGNIDEAISLAEESAALDRKTGNMATLSMSLMILAFSHQILGEWSKSERYYKEALSTSQKVSQVWSSEAYATLGQFYLTCTREYVKARENLEKADKICKKTKGKYEQMYFSRYLAWTYIELGEIDKANSLIDNLNKFAINENDNEFVAKADALKANLFRAQKRWKESIKFFEKSLQEHEDLDAGQWDIYRFAKWIFCEYARVYLERKREGDREKALSLLNRALSIFKKLGAKKDIREIMAKKKLLQT